MPDPTPTPTTDHAASMDKPAPLVGVKPGEFGARYAEYMAKAKGEAATPANAPAPPQPAPAATPQAAPATTTPPPEPATPAAVITPESSAIKPAEPQPLEYRKADAKPPEPPKAPDATPAPETPPEKLTHKDYAALAESRKAAFAERDQLKAQLKEAQEKLAATPAAPKDYDALKADVEKYKGLVARFDLEHSPEFQAAFTHKIDQEIKDAVGTVEGETASTLEAILKSPPSKHRDTQIKDLVAELPSDYEKTSVVSAYRNLRTIEASRKAELDKSSDNLKRLEEHRAKQAEALTKQQLTEREQAIESELQEASQHVEIFKDATLQAQARSLVKNPNPNTLARLAVMATGFPKQQEEIAMLREMTRRQAEQIAALQGTTPQPTTTHGGEAPREMTPEERYHAAKSGKVQVSE